MTVQTTTSRADYTGNGTTTAFTVPFYFLDNTHLTVLRTVIATGVSTTLVLNTDYTVTGAGVSSGGTVTCTIAPTSAQKLSILRNVPLTQLIHYVPNDPFPAASHEQALDQLTMEMQQVNEQLSRAIVLPPATTGVSTALPTAAASQLIAFNNTGTALTTVNPSDVITVAGSSGFQYQTFSGNAATTAFTLTNTPGAIGNCEVFIAGVRQRPVTDYTLSGVTLTFVAAPPTGTNNILVRWGTTLGIGIPNDGSVTPAKMSTGAPSWDASGNLTAGGGVTATGSVTDNKGNVRSIVQNAQTSAYVLVAADAGKFINITTGGVTVNTSVFSVGDAVTIYNNSASSQTITQGASVTMYLAGTATTGNRTIAQRGVATILCVAANTFVISGAGVT